MKPFCYLLPAIAWVVVGFTTMDAKAQDASFGCKILLVDFRRELTRD